MKKQSVSVKTRGSNSASPGTLLMSRVQNSVFRMQISIRNISLDSLELRNRNISNNWNWNCELETSVATEAGTASRKLKLQLYCRNTRTSPSQYEGLSNGYETSSAVNYFIYLCGHTATFKVVSLHHNPAFLPFLQCALDVHCSKHVEHILRFALDIHDGPLLVFQLCSSALETSISLKTTVHDSWQHHRIHMQRLCNRFVEFHTKFHIRCLLMLESRSGSAHGHKSMCFSATDPHNTIYLSMLTYGCPGSLWLCGLLSAGVLQKWYRNFLIPTS
ncbi:hypothetical protein AVEN_229584-1 [Araneus ventricosus]|uniref:Uncharacterized protein n=1 Tax=Araneus ventricosus TaxID=182803 RepID=A0A4Y2DBJ4_ARAVE|nr:hypothetical protein AVEN_229584-1 [Araneus ventricosus]